jgi:type III restriction enzyme
MALQLKHYQRESLEVLADYFRRVVEHADSRKAFHYLIADREDDPRSYTEVPGLVGLPYVCLRLPTGGGKTLLACYAVPVANKDLLQSDHSVVLWLVPSNAIREQTLGALRNRAHPYRVALESQLGEVTVCDTTEALYLQRPVLDGSTVIIVATLQSFRIEDETGRKVYESSGALQHHFSGLDRMTLDAIEKRDDGSFPYSLANVLRIRRPIVIVDEAHNARTALSFKTLAKFRPSAIIELTATPSLSNEGDEQFASNVLHHVSAKELEAEDMIKLPVRLETHANWQVLLAHAIAQLDQLDADATTERRKSGEVIRPIMLIKAESRRGTSPITYDVVKEHLITQCNIPEEQIAIETGNVREATGQNLMAEDCRIRFVITVDALKEGWDCPFAYILCSVGELRAQTAVEQLLGRVLRMPYARRKSTQSLNRAYSFASSSSFANAAAALEACLVESGFNRLEAKELITRSTATQQDLPIAKRKPVPRTFKSTELPAKDSLPESIREKVEIDEENSSITFTDTLDKGELEALEATFVMDKSREAFRQEYERFETETVELMKAPSEKGMFFGVPRLTMEINGQIELFEETLLSDRGWRLAHFLDEARLDDWPVHEDGSRYGQLSVDDQGKLRVEFLQNLDQELKLITSVENWTEAQLVSWIDRSIPHPDIAPDDSLLFIGKVIEYLQSVRSLPIASLTRDRHSLSKAVAEIFKSCREDAHAVAFQEVLFKEKEGRILVSGHEVLRFDPDRYPCNSVCPKSSYFRKHYYPQVGDLKGEGEEFECAAFIDSLEEVEFWVRNLERKPGAFWLPTSTDRFYPDFVAKLKDGRIFVIEYKGANLWSNDDSKEKRRIGELWAEKSDSRCLFLMPRGDTLESILHRIRKG